MEIDSDPKMEIDVTPASMAKSWTVRLRGPVGSAERSFYLEPGESTIGSSPASDVALDARGVSREHALLRFFAGGLVVEDCGSTNGTFVDGVRVDRAGVPFGAELRFGPVRLRVERIDREDAELGLVLHSPAVPRVREARASATAWLPESEEPSSVSEGVAEKARLLFPDGYHAGSAPAMTALYRQMRRLLKGDLPVLIVGETGVGKDRVAEILHASSDRGGGPFVALNCAAIPADLLEAELFGIGGGVATGVKPRPGRFLQAEGGTLFLDEVAEMAPELQAKMLRAIENKEILPLGGAARAVDVRILAATNADLLKKIDRGQFRSDLYYRLAGYVLDVPPLRHCRSDLPDLVRHFLSRFGDEIGVSIRGVTVSALRRLESHAWPGNVRELIHEMRRLAHLSSDAQVIDAEMLSAGFRSVCEPAASSADPDHIDGPLDLERQVRELETRLIREALRRADGVHLRAARLLGLHRNSLRHKMKRLGIEGGAEI